MNLSYFNRAGIIALGLFSVFLIPTTGCEKNDDNNQGKDDPEEISGYPVAGTNQVAFYNNQTVIGAPGPDEAFYGQNAHYPGTSPSYRDNGDGTITDLVTGLMWQQSPDTDGDGDIDFDDKLTFDEAMAGASAFRLGGYEDWRLPSVKELYSLIIFSGIDPSGYEGNSTEDLVPFIDTDYFAFAYGDTDAGERIIDAQYASSTKYVDFTMVGNETMFGVNFADGRIKGYGVYHHGSYKTFYVMYVRGNPEYGLNLLQSNNDGTITDNATGLMWMQDDNGEGMSWEEALEYAENLEFAGYSDWRLPDIKELQSIVDYSRSPATSESAAIDPLLHSTEIINEAGETDYPFYWSGTTHANRTSLAGGANAAYVSFGRAMGYMFEWLDVHGAGAQRSDPKTGSPDNFPYGRGPQGDAIRIYNYVRCVRNIE